MTFSNMLKEQASAAWEEGYAHGFVQGIGAGTLEQEAFKFYLMQDYWYLLGYAKVMALGVVKAQEERSMALFSQAQHGILNGEMTLHREYMASFGVTREEMDSIVPALNNRAYVGHMLSAAQQGGVAEIIAAVLPCAWTYADYAKRLKARYADRIENNPYASWIHTYAGEGFAQSFEWFFPLLEKLSANMGEEAKQNIVRIFVDSTRFECLFWDMALKKQL